MLDDTEMRGHTYDLDMMSAPAKYLLAHRSLDDSPSDDDLQRVARRIALLQVALEQQALRLHGTMLVRPDLKGLCPCGLVLPEGVEAAEATGHVDLGRTWRLTTTVVVLVEVERYAVVCQSCAWRRYFEVLDAAHAAADAHVLQQHPECA